MFQYFTVFICFTFFKLLCKLSFNFILFEKEGESVRQREQIIPET